jgi:broad specificity phosphatase PhoE
MARLPQVHLVRHGETAWSISRQHTGRSDIPLTQAGEDAARRLPGRLSEQSFAVIWSSPSQRAMQTARLAGFGAEVIPSDDLAEWDYGAYEGRTTNDILTENPEWRLFRDGCPQGEMPGDVAARADRVIARLRGLDTDTLIFSSAHILRVIAARWIGLPVGGAALFLLETASISILGYEHDASEPIIRAWNKT